MIAFQVGDRVRLKAGPRYPGYKPGDTGTIAAKLPTTTRIGVELFEVIMDRERRSMLPAFYADELELVQ
jgi:hypothetical protein